MVVVSPSKSKAWVSAMRFPGFSQSAEDRALQLKRHRDDRSGPAKSGRHLGILGFEAARTMCRLVSLHRALSDAEVARAHAAMGSRGVAFMNSADQGHLLRLACAEAVDDLDAAAEAVVRLARRCPVGAWPHGFESTYAEIKAGVGDVSKLGLGPQPKDVEKKVKKMEKYVASTSALYVAMESLKDLEAWNQHTAGRRPLPPQAAEAFDVLLKRLVQQRQHVRQLRDESLWGRNVDKVADLMARSVVTVFGRLCFVYGASVTELPHVAPGRHGRLELAPPRPTARVCRRPGGQYPALRTANGYASGPLDIRPPSGDEGADVLVIRNSGPILRPRGAEESERWKEKVLEPLTGTLGASGLALRYAEVIAMVEGLASSPEPAVTEETRQELYWMLPAGTRAAVIAKLRGHRGMDEKGGGHEAGEALAEGWREAVEGILGWLAPMARDTVQWYADRSFEQRRLEFAPRVPVLRTLVFSDKEKAEAAIVELLVAFSCVCRYRQGGTRP